MDVKHEDLSLCNACLCVGRNLYQITEERAKEFYVKALSEIPLFSPSTKVPPVCYECRISLQRAVNFREQVKDSYRILVTYTSENLQSLISDVSRPPRLKVKVNDNINIEGAYSFELFDDDFKNDKNEETVTQKCLANEIQMPSTQRVFVKEEDIKLEMDNSDMDAVYSDSQDSTPIDSLDVNNEIKCVPKGNKTRKKVKEKRKVKKVKTLNKKNRTKSKQAISDIIKIDLSLEEIAQERNKEYEKDSYMRAEFKCDTCIIGFNYEKSFKTHLKTKHSPEIGDYTCPICKTVLVSVDSFTTHYKRHMRRFECGVCQKRTVDAKVMEQHYFTTHGISLKKYKCNECGIISKSIDSHRYHADTHKSRLQCTQCDKTFRHRGGLLNHKLTVHELQNYFPCNLCNKVFRWKNSLKRHLDTHESKNKMAVDAAFCEACNIGFASTSSYQRHLNNSLKHVTKDDFRFICDHCHRRFSNKTKLRDHIEEKHLHKTYQCQICLKVSKNRVNLDQHIRNVHKGRPFNKICQHCGKRFPTKVQLESHIRAHTGERPFICEYCPTTFSQQSNLYKHNRQVHLNMKSKRYPISKKRKEDSLPINAEMSLDYNPIELAFHM